MRVLLTNRTLDERAGTELYVRDVALALLARGHQPIAYSRRLGEVAEELRRATVPVLDDLEGLDRPPDLIHAQHHLEAMTALSRFPHTPAVYVCHGWLPDEEAPPSHPQILRYVAVDELVRQRLVDECGLAEERVETHLNFVDLERFRPRPPLPERPQRALVFSNLVHDGNCLPALREACHETGLALDTVGRSVGRPSAAPEEILGSYDIVFAKGRAALEAAAVGAAVILCDRSGLGQMVTAEDLERLRRFNFGVRLLRRKVTVEAVVREIGRYDAEDAGEVNRLIRQQLDMDAAVDRLVGLYQRVLEEAVAGSFDEREVARATSRYLRRGPLSSGDFFRSEREHLQAEVDHARNWAYDLHEHLTQAFDERKRVEGRLALAEAERQSLAARLEDLVDETARHRARAEEAEQRVEVLERELDQVTEEADHQRQQLDDSRQQLNNSGQELALSTERLERCREQLDRCDEERARHLDLAKHGEKQLEDCHQQLEQLGSLASDLEAELAWIRSSTTWRWRERLVNQRWLAAIYRLLFGRGASL